MTYRSRSKLPARAIAACAAATCLGSPPLTSAYAQAPQPGRNTEPATVEIIVTGLRNASGKVWLCLWREGATQGFPSCDKGKPAAGASAPASAPRVTLNGVRPGTYAVSLFHDEKGTGVPEVNALGMPKSGIGISNNPVILGPPTFAAASFAVPRTTRLTIQARYLF